MKMRNSWVSGDSRIPGEAAAIPLKLLLSLYLQSLYLPMRHWNILILNFAMLCVNFKGKLKPSPSQLIHRRLLPVTSHFLYALCPWEYETAVERGHPQAEPKMSQKLCPHRKQSVTQLSEANIKKTVTRGYKAFGQTVLQTLVWLVVQPNSQHL